MTIASDSWGQWECPTAIDYRRKGRLLRFNISTAIPEPKEKLIQAKYFGKVRDDIEIAECSVSQLKVKANDSDPIES